MTQAATIELRFETAAGLPLVSACGGDRLTSDGALSWLAEAEAVTGVGSPAARARWWVKHYRGS